MSATSTIAALTLALAVNLTDAAVFPTDDANGNTRKATIAQMRTQLNTGAQIFTTSISVGTTLTVTGTSGFSDDVTIVGAASGKKLTLGDATHYVKLVLLGGSYVLANNTTGFSVNNAADSANLFQVAPAGGATVFGGGYTGTGEALSIGADLSAVTRTNNTAKIGVITAAHYANASAPMLILSGYTPVGENRIEIGGGLSGYNAATGIYFYTGPTTTTATGIARLILVGVAGSPAGSSTGNIFLADSTAPTGNPSNGGYFFSVAGALKWRGSSGTVTTIAPA
jgi:hypothetical protein